MSQAAAVRTLIRELGFLRAMRVALAVRRGPDPFGHLPPPEDDREKRSRAQIAPAILLYRELRKHTPEALRIAEEIIVAGARTFLRKQVGAVRPRRLERMSSEARRRWVEKTGEAFFNATIEWKRIDAREVRFDVTACRFPALCRAAGVPELAPAFCRGDALFFRRGVAFERTRTIAEGAKLCDFRITAR